MKRLLVLIPVLLLIGCFSAEVSSFTSIGSNCKVSVYSGNQLVREFRSNGKVLTESGTDGWYFTNKETGKLVRVSGTVVIEIE